MVYIAPPLDTISELRTPKSPMSITALLQTEPGPVTSTELPTLLLAPPMRRSPLDTAPPLAMIMELPGPLLPMYSRPLLFQTEPVPVTTTVLLLLEL